MKLFLLIISAVAFILNLVDFAFNTDDLGRGLMTIITLIWYVHINNTIKDEK